eukprot:TRINITY_DN13992_c0_g1_i1.p1 TRINITY_DN13992_c0_g1~~TRINITY_DN13992_c0_g1_i1.p1  ORF type:complete len:161 (-),score=24.39 TRINITY_DN13992_c0_g1_i1:55-537(-)
MYRLVSKLNRSSLYRNHNKSSKRGYAKQKKLPPLPKHVDRVVTPEDLYWTLRSSKEPLLLDSRSATDYKQFRILGTINVPVDTDEEKLKRVPKDRPIYVLGSYEGPTVNSAYQLADRLINIGHPSVFVVGAGLPQLKEAGFGYYLDHTHKPEEPPKETKK